jgi:GAF domain-containing protein
MPEHRDSSLAALTGQLLSLLSNAPHLDEFLGRVAHLATTLVSPPASCGITLRRDHQPFTVVASDDLAAQVDEIQYGRDQGPCLESLRTGAVVQVDDLTRDDRWDGYPAHALAYGVVSSLSLPVIIDGLPVAAVNLYSGRPAAFNGLPRQQAEAFAGQCAVALDLMLRQTDQTEVQRQLLEAFTSRSTIDHASASTWASNAVPPARRSTCSAKPPNTATASSATSPPTSSPGSPAYHLSHPANSESDRTRAGPTKLSRG